MRQFSWAALHSDYKLKNKGVLKYFAPHLAKHAVEEWQETGGWKKGSIRAAPQYRVITPLYFSKEV